MGGNRFHSTGLAITLRPLTLVLVLFAGATPVLAEPVRGKLFTVHQPDGTPLEVRVWGDEFYRVFESVDGYTLIRDPSSRMMCYAERSADGNELFSTGIPAGPNMSGSLGLERHLRINSASARSQALAARRALSHGEVQGPIVGSAARSRDWPYPPCNGDLQGICLIVDFSDQPATIPRSHLEAFVNQVGYTGYGNNGSVHDYYFDASDGILNYTNYVPAAYYRAQHPRSYYEDPSVPFGQRAQELIAEALVNLDNQGFDFSEYDCNDDLRIDGVSCYYAGTRIADGHLWPHCSSGEFFSADGVGTYKYMITDIGVAPSLYVFCHETGHMIGGWPDLYDYDGDSAGIGNYCLMCDGGPMETNPVEPNPFLKDIAGWGNTTLLTPAHSGMTFSLEAGFNTFYKFEHPTLSHEYYIIQNRQQLDHDAGLPDDGLAIWHIDHTGCNDYQQGTPEFHYLAALIQADGDRDLENNRNLGDDTDLWDAPEYTDCTPETDPNTNWWDGSSSEVFITNISPSGPTMTFTYNMSPAEPIPTVSGWGIVVMGLLVLTGGTVVARRRESRLRKV